MRKPKGMILLSALIGWAVPAAMTAAQEAVVAPAEAIREPLSLQIRAEPNGVIIGSVRNHGPRAIRNVRLLVRHVWLWKNERHPGPPADNPGRSAYFEVAGEVPPGGDTRFRYVPEPPLPQRTDGSFVTTADIVGFLEAGGTAPAEQE